jgi:uncharacterized protein (TIRG00374 family)
LIGQVIISLQKIRFSGNLQFALGLPVCGIGLYFAFRNWDSSDLNSLFDTIQYGGIVWAMIFSIVSIFIRAQRWQKILMPLGEAGVWHLFRSTMIGYFGNGFLPARLGEVMKCLVARKLIPDIPVTSIFGSVVVERTLDLIGLSVVALIIVLTNPLPDWLISAVIFLLILTSCAGAALYLAAQYQDALASIFGKAWQRLSGREFEILLRLGQQFFAGLTTLASHGRFTVIILHTAIYWAMQWGLLHSVALALSMDISWLQTGIVLLATMLATSIPSVPANVGVFHAAAVIVLTSILDYSPETGIAFAIISHGIRVMLVIGIGGLLAALVLLNEKEQDRL